MLFSDYIEQDTHFLEDLSHLKIKLKKKKRRLCLKAFDLILKSEVVASVDEYVQKIPEGKMCADIVVNGFAPSTLNWIFHKAISRYYSEYPQVDGEGKQQSSLIRIF